MPPKIKSRTKHTTTKHKSTKTRPTGKKLHDQLSYDPGLYGFSPFTLLNMHDMTQNNAMMDLPIWQRGLKFSGKPFSTYGAMATSGSGGLFGSSFSPFFSGEPFTIADMSTSDATLLEKTSFQKQPTPLGSERIKELEEGIAFEKKRKEEKEKEKLTILPEYSGFFRGGKNMSFEDYYKQYVNRDPSKKINDIPKNMTPSDRIEIKYGMHDKVDDALNITQDFFKKRSELADYAYDGVDAGEQGAYGSVMDTFGKSETGGRKRRAKKRTTKKKSATTKRTTTKKIHHHRLVKRKGCKK